MSLGTNAAHRRSRLIEAAQESWVAALTDLGGRNTLLYYKDRRSGTLDLAAADPAAVEQFVSSGSIRLSRLFRDVDARADAIRRLQVIYRKARELLEERGIRAGYLATGMARWDELFLLPAAPVLLRGLTITPTRARHDDFELVLDDEYEVNPVLLYKLASLYGAATDKLADERGERLYQLLRRAANAAEVPGFDIADRMVIGTFTYAKLPMVRDVQGGGALLNDSDVVAAIAGDPEAQELLGPDSGDAGDEDAAEILLDAPDSDYSVLDADSSQRSAIAAVLTGHSLVIHGPPGTGKSQTIANLIAGLVARGRKVLFVAEKRAAIDAVLSRLKGVDLGELVLDIHDGTRDRQRIARDLGESLDLAQRAQVPHDEGQQRRLADRQRKLTDHVKALHEAHPPWGITPFGVQSALLGIPDQAKTPVRLAAPERITRLVAEDLRDELKEFAHLGGFSMRPGATAWFGARLRSAEDVRQACNLAAELSSYTVPRLLDLQARSAAALGLRAPAGYADVLARMRLYADVGQTLAALSDEVFAANPRALADAVAGTGDASMGERRRLRKEARSLPLAGDKLGREDLVSLLANAERQLHDWERERVSEDGPLPRMPDDYADLQAALGDCLQRFDVLGGFVTLSPDATIEQLAALAADQDTAWKLPRLYELAAKFDRLGIGPLLDELARNEATAELAAAAFDHAWYSSILDQIRVRDPRYAAERGNSLDELADDFRQRDVEHLIANRRRVRHAWAERVREAQDQHPLQARVIRKQAALRRGHLPLRRLLDQTSDVLFALKPCWAMSPLMVSQILPATRLFDVVIFDEASQIVPADAIPAIMRGHQIVVAGDDRQLPPTNFFRQVGEADDGQDDDRVDISGVYQSTGEDLDDLRDDEDETLVSFGVGFESVLDALRPLLPTWPLAWHYRSRDERLVAFSNAHIYGGALTTFPGVFRDDCLRHVVVKQSPEPGQEVSVTAEVHKVVELILEHARARPHESLGVIALGIKHADRIDSALRAALTANGDVERFFSEDAAEPFFVKNLERVQGDERDAIILSIGYGKHPDGRMRYNWGPLLRDGGERRLNVAATRAKQRLTLVSSFSGHDVDPERVSKAGARMLADYLDYAASGGTVATATGGDDSSLSPFETDVRDRLAASGITVVPQYGVGGYRVDFAATHPDDTDRMVLAIEADGNSYHRSGSVRDRDRLRGEHLRRLGWSFHRIWSTSWFHDPDSEVAKLQTAYQQAVSDAEVTGPAPADPEPAAARPDPAPAKSDPPAAEPDQAPAGPEPLLVIADQLSETDRAQLAGRPARALPAAPAAEVGQELVKANPDGDTPVTGR